MNHSLVFSSLKFSIDSKNSAHLNKVLFINFIQRFIVKYKLEKENMAQWQRI